MKACRNVDSDKNNNQQTNQLCIILLALTLASCSSTSPTSQTQYRNAGSQVPDLGLKYEAPEPKCSTSTPKGLFERVINIPQTHHKCSADAKKEISEITSQIQSAEYCAITDESELKLMSVTGRNRLAESVVRINMSNWFMLADGALEIGCLKEADDIYRSILNFKVGYLPERDAADAKDRAKVGVEDVREKTRNSKQAKL